MTDTRCRPVCVNRIGMGATMIRVTREELAMILEAAARVARRTGSRFVIR